ncbi:MAG TPA: methyltransferase domain-containing protein [Candidatus Nanopelagicales bacterium]|jgi:SAM-dependent methyltransferase|nr:methyltransferase domain-containing protein [Candidatus Nanopelagicales bacterium]
MPEHSWDAAGYDERFSFVTERGVDLLELVDAGPQDRILDLGCGTGHQAAALAATGAVVVGVDADDAMLASARRAYPLLQFQRGDGQDLPIGALLRAVGDRPYDVVLSNAALHWMPDQDAVVAGVGRLLRPGGRFVAELGGVGNVARLADAIDAGRHAVGLGPVPMPWTFPTPAQAATLLERHGFRVRSLALFDRPTPLADGDSAATWATMFVADLLTDVPAGRRSELAEAIDARARRLGLAERPDGAPGWWGDYVRLRFVAEQR